jgi:hypothetical protein
MENDRLKPLIERADFPPPDPIAPPVELARRVRRLYRQRRRRRTAAIAAAGIACALALWFGLTNRQGNDLARQESQKQTISPSLAAGDESIRELNARIELDESVISQLLAAERQQRIAAARASIKNRQPLFDEQVGTAAMALLLSAEARATRPDGVQAARDDLNYLMHVFPDTIWAARAGEKLAAIGP